MLISLLIVLIFKSLLIRIWLFYLFQMIKLFKTFGICLNYSIKRGRSSSSEKVCNCNRNYVTSILFKVQYNDLLHMFQVQLSKLIMTCPFRKSAIFKQNISQCWFLPWQVFHNCVHFQLIWWRWLKTILNSHHDPTERNFLLALPLVVYKNEQEAKEILPPHKFRQPFRTYQPYQWHQHLGDSTLSNELPSRLHLLPSVIYRCKIWDKNESNT